jgi:hypothetical protein
MASIFFVIEMFGQVRSNWTEMMLNPSQDYANIRQLSKRTVGAVVFFATSLLIIIYIFDTNYCKGVLNYENSK